MRRREQAAATFEAALLAALDSVDERNDGRLDLAELVAAGFDGALLAGLATGRDGSLDKRQLVERLSSIAREEDDEGGQLSGSEYTPELLRSLLTTVARILHRRKAEAVASERRAAEAEKNAMLALHGPRLAALAEENNATIGAQQAAALVCSRARA